MPSFSLHWFLAILSSPLRGPHPIHAPWLVPFPSPSASPSLLALFSLSLPLPIPSLVILFLSLRVLHLPHPHPLLYQLTVLFLIFVDSFAIPCLSFTGPSPIPAQSPPPPPSATPTCQVTTLLLLPPKLRSLRNYPGRLSIVRGRPRPLISPRAHISLSPARASGPSQPRELLDLLMCLLKCRTF